MKSLFINALLASSVAFLLGGVSSAMSGGSANDDCSVSPARSRSPSVNPPSRDPSMERKKAKTEREPRRASSPLLVAHNTPVGAIPLPPTCSGIFRDPLEIPGMRGLPVFELDPKASDEWGTPEKPRQLRGLWGSPPTKHYTSNHPVSFLSFQPPPTSPSYPS